MTRRQQLFIYLGLIADVLLFFWKPLFTDTYLFPWDFRYVQLPLISFLASMCIRDRDYSNADLITVYLLPNTIDQKVRPILEKQIKKGARVVSHDFNFVGWKHTNSMTIDDDGEGRAHTLYLYVR